MAVRRHPISAAPVELLTFRPDDWVGDAPGYQSPVESWHDARFEWARTHLNDFSLGGDVIDILFERVE